jgi:hypothetical protein
MEPLMELSGFEVFLHVPESPNRWSVRGLAGVEMLADRGQRDIRDRQVQIRDGRHDDE